MKNLGYYGRRNICGERVRMARLAKRISQETLAAKMQTKGVNIYSQKFRLDRRRTV